LLLAVVARNKELLSRLTTAAHYLVILLLRATANAAGWLWFSHPLCCQQTAGDGDATVAAPIPNALFLNLSLSLSWEHFSQPISSQQQISTAKHSTAQQSFVLLDKFRCGKMRLSA
jgi:hypothetical protein